MQTHHGAPASLGPYRIQGELGRGGMGVVYRAIHTETLTPAAVKTVFDGKLSGTQSLRLEMRALRRLQHPGVVNILNHGEERGRPWIAMELLEGQTLATCFDKSSGAPATFTTRAEPTLPEAAAHDVELPLPPPRTTAPADLSDRLALVCEICTILGYVHGEGMVHRDLKPANIFVRDDGSPVLVDFGLVQRFQHDGVREDLRMAEGPVGGTLRYTSPEQLSGGLVDARSDLYSLGCILYELVCGQPPFVGTARSVVRQHLTTVVTPLFLKVPNAPSGLSTLLDKLLAKRPQDRLGNAMAVRAHLVRLLPEGPFTRPPPTPRPWLFRPSLVDRDDELAWLIRRVKQARAEQGTLSAILGDPGCGKTRLLAEGAAATRSLGVTVIKAACHAATPAVARGGQVEGDGLRAFLRHVADVCRQDPDARARLLPEPRAAVFAHIDPLIGDLAEETAPLRNPEDERVRLLAWLVDLLAAWAQDHPTMLALDDVQWADNLTRELLTRLIEHGVPPGLAIVTTCRPGEATWLDTVDAVSLSPLRRSSIAVVAGNMLGLSTLPEGLLELTAEVTQGNPRMLAELLHVAVDLGHLRPTPEGRWSFQWAVQAAELSPHPRAQDLSALRVAQLPEPARTMLVILAEAGTSLLLDQLLQVAMEDGAVDEERALDVAGQLLAQGFMERQSTGRLGLVHDGVGEAASASISTERTGLHRSLAALLSTDPGIPPEVVADHWLGAQAPSTAWIWLLRGALVAGQVGAVARCRALVDQATAIHPLNAPPEDTGGLDLVEVETAWLGALVQSGESDAAEDLVRRRLARAGERWPHQPWRKGVLFATALAGLMWARLRPPPPWASDEDARQGMQVGQAVGLLATSHMHKNKPIQAIVGSIIALYHARRARPEDPIAPLMTGLAAFLVFMGFETWSSQVLALAYTHARQSGRDLQSVYTIDVFCSLCRARWARLDQLSRPALDAAHRTGDIQSQVRIMVFALSSDVIRGRIRDRIPVCQSAVTLARNNGYPDQLILLTQLAQLNVLKGDLDAAAAALDTIAGIPLPVDAPNFAASVCEAKLLHAMARDHADGVEDLTATLSEMITSQRMLNPGYTTAAIRAAEGWLWIAERRPARRTDALERVVPLLRSLKRLGRMTVACAVMRPVLVARRQRLLGDPMAALRTIQSILPRLEDDGYIAYEACARRELALIHPADAAVQHDRIRNLCAAADLQVPLPFLPPPSAA